MRDVFAGSLIAAALLVGSLANTTARADSGVDVRADLRAEVRAEVRVEPAITRATARGTEGARNARDPTTQSALTPRKKWDLLRKKVKYVFVLFQENRSFDHYFGTYPGANGLFATYPGARDDDPYAMPANRFGSFHSVIRNTDGSYSTISPFLIPRTIVNLSGKTVQLYPESLFSVDHSHAGYLNDLHTDLATQSSPKNDGYALDQQGLHYSTDASGVRAPIVDAKGLPPTINPDLLSKQRAEVVMAHVDCDTVPFLWQYADRFVLFDNFHQTAIGPSTPNAIAMIAGQVGDTQWVKHADAPSAAADAAALAVPNLTDSAPFAGSGRDDAPVQPPYGPDEASNPLSGPPFLSKHEQATLTFATLPLSFMGNRIDTIIGADQHPELDLADVRRDIPVIAKDNPNVDWGWYQQGYGPEPFDGTPLSENGSSSRFLYDAAPEHASYIVHHNGPQYFGYLGDNPKELAHLHSLQQFYVDIAHGALPAAGGVYYVRGGYYNNDGLLPADPNPNVRASTPGNDDHPDYSDAQISEALVADSVNAIANSPYWDQSVILITYDESDGQFDHQPERFRSYGPDHHPETGGPRIPAILISPYAAAHIVSHVYSEHSSVIKFIDELFGLTPLAKLPDEAQAASYGAAQARFNGPQGPQQGLGPADGLESMGDLIEAFDDERLTGAARALGKDYAIIPRTEVLRLPHYVSTAASGAPRYGCQALGITPTDYPNGYSTGGEIDPPPRDFNPRPVQSPGVPYLDTNSNTAAPATGAWPG